ncbi:hypothetical protein [Xenorhabdus nematophila]|nr:hypothetical protein [Xenorhabdus nematophila]
MLYMNASRLQDKNYSDIDGRLQLYIRPYYSQSCGPRCNPLTDSSLS